MLVLMMKSTKKQNKKTLQLLSIKKITFCLRECHREYPFFMNLEKNDIYNNEKTTQGLIIDAWNLNRFAKNSVERFDC